MKKRDLAIISAVYAVAYICGFVFSKRFDDIIIKFLMFDLMATFVTFIFSVIFRNSSVYDAYWSLTPMVMSVWLFVKFGAFQFWQIVFIAVFNIWSARLTYNWITVFTDFSYEDWRYRHYRNITPKLLWPLVNFFGIHLFPTVVVFLGMLPLFPIAEGHIGPLSVIGIIVMLAGILLELSSDKSMHEFLESQKDGDKKQVIKEGLWKYSRHPNYLGEILVWVGVFLSMIFYQKAKWYYMIGAASIALMFNIVSIPLMEKRQLERRPEYKEYMEETPRLLIRFRH